MAQDVRKTLVVLSQIKTALEVGMKPLDAICLAMESPNVSGLFSAEQVKNVIQDVESGKRCSIALSKLDIFSEYDQSIIQAGEGYNGLESAFDMVINQHMFIRSLGV